MKRIILAMGALVGAIAVAQGQDFTGYIGVYVSPSDFGGVTIQRFIPILQHPKQTLLVKLDGETPSSNLLVDLSILITIYFEPEITIPYGREGKLVLRGPDGSYYFLWISRKDPAVAAAAYGGSSMPVEAARAAALMAFAKAVRETEVLTVISVMRMV